LLPGFSNTYLRLAILNLIRSCQEDEFACQGFCYRQYLQYQKSLRSAELIGNKKGQGSGPDPAAMSGPLVSTRLVRSVDNPVRTQLSSFEAPDPERG
jgi:hypothetical protein